MGKCMSIAVAVVLLVLAANAATPLEGKLVAMRSLDPSREQLVQLFLLRTNAPNAAIQSTVTKACAAGLCSLGQTESYSKMRNGVEDVEAMEAAMCIPCDNCNKRAQNTRDANRPRSSDQGDPFVATGEADKSGGLDGQAQPTTTPGNTATKCFSCKGSGRCSVASCNEGRRTLTGFDGNTKEVACGSCNGSGKCQKCSGTGSVMLTCPVCKGKGSVFSKSAALKLYKDYMEQAIAAYEVDRNKALALEEKKKMEVELRLAQAEEKRRLAEHAEKLRQAEVDAKKIAAAAEGEAAGKERARIAVEKEREAARKEDEKKYADLDRKYLKSVVVIEGERSVGTGFLCVFGGRKVVLSNAHVLCGNRTIRLRSLSGKDLPHTGVSVCKGRDIVAYELAETAGLDFLPLYGAVTNMNNQEDVVVFGNSQGGGVVTTLRGRMKGIGPESIEVDAMFVHGNSGSPIIAYPYGAVVGMATYATQNPEVDWTNRSTRFTEVRRYGVRLDQICWADFFALDGRAYGHALDVYDEIYAFANNEVLKARWLGDYYRATPEVKAKAERLLGLYRQTPEWMRQYADDAALAAFVCTVILK